MVRVIAHLRVCKAEGTLVIPLWKSSYFWPLLCYVLYVVMFFPCTSSHLETRPSLLSGKCFFELREGQSLGNCAKTNMVNPIFHWTKLKKIRLSKLYPSFKNFSLFNFSKKL